MFKSQFADKRAVKTHQAIQEAFQALVARKNCDEISVADITNEADVNRKTFYQYYDYREDIFDEMVQGIVDRYEQAMIVDAVLPPPTSYDFYVRFFTFFAEQKPYVDQVITNATYGMYRARIVEECAKVNRRRRNMYIAMNDEERALFQNYCAHNMVAMYARWVELGKTIPLDHLIAFAYKIEFQGRPAFFDYEE